MTEKEIIDTLHTAISEVERLEKKKFAKHRYNYCPKCGQALDCGEVRKW